MHAVVTDLAFNCLDEVGPTCLNPLDIRPTMRHSVVARMALPGFICCGFIELENKLKRQKTIWRPTFSGSATSSCTDCTLYTVDSIF